MAAVAAGHAEHVRFDAFDQTERLEVGEDALARRIKVEAAVGRRHFVVERCRRRHDVDQRQRVAPADLVVVEIMRGRDFHAAAAELRVDVFVADHRDLACRERQAQSAADQGAIALIRRVHGHRRVAQHGFRPRGRDHQMAAAVRQGIAQMPQTAVLLGGDHLQVGQGGLEHRVPVHQPLAAVDQTLGMQPHEHLGHGARERRIHGELVAAPVDRRAQAAQLVGDHAAGLLLPAPDAFDERIAAHFKAAPAFRVELSLHHHLGGDSSMVGAGLPERVESAHAPVADERIHDGVLEGVAHVQRAGDVGGRDDDRIGGTAAAGRERAEALPSGVDPRFDVGGREGFIHGSPGSMPVRAARGR